MCDSSHRRLKSLWDRPFLTAQWPRVREVLCLPVVVRFILCCAFTSSASSANVILQIITMLDIYLCLRKRLLICSSSCSLRHSEQMISRQQWFKTSAFSWRMKKCLSYQTWWLTEGDPTLRCRIDSSSKASPTQAAVGDVEETHNWSSWFRFTSICCFSFPLHRRPSTSWASSRTGCVQLRGRVTPCKRRQGMSRMPSSLFPQSLNHIHFIKEKKEKGLQEALFKKALVCTKYISGCLYLYILRISVLNFKATFLSTSHIEHAGASSKK